MTSPFFLPYLRLFLFFLLSVSYRNYGNNSLRKFLYCSAYVHSQLHPPQILFGRDKKEKPFRIQVLQFLSFYKLQFLFITGWLKKNGPYQVVAKFIFPFVILR